MKRILMMKKENNLSNYIWNAGGTSIYAFSSLLFLIIVERINGIKSAGLFSFVFALSLIFYTASIYGGRIYHVSDVKTEFIDNNYINTRIFTIIISFIILIVFLLFSNYEHNKIILALIISGTKCFEAFSDSLYGIIQKNNRLDIVGKSLTFKTIISVLIFLIIDINTKNLVFAASGFLLVNITVTIFVDYNIANRYSSIKLFSNKNIFKIINKSKYIFLFTIITLLIINVPRFVVDSLFNEELNGYFGIIIMIPTLIALFGQFIIQPMLVSLSNLYNTKKIDDFSKKIYKILFYVLFLGIIISVIAYFIGPVALKILYGLSFDKYRVGIFIVTLGGVFNTFATVISNALTVMRITKSQFIMYVINLATAIILCIILVKQYDFLGIFISYLIIMIIQFIMFMGFLMLKINKVEVK